jgi:hypothetical protein
MSKLYLGKINLSKIDKSKIFEGKTGKWVDVTIWLNDKPDNYGNDMSIEQSSEKGKDKIFLGNAKSYEKKGPVDSAKVSENMGRTTAPDDSEGLPF